MKIGDRFKNVSTGEIFTIAKINEKFKQIAVAGEDGNVKPYSSSTLKDKRRFVPVDVEGDQWTDPSYEERQKKQAESDKIAEDTVNAIKSEKTQKKTSKKTKEPAPGIGTDIKNYAVTTARKLGAEICESNGRFISFKVNNKMFAAIFSYSKKSLTLGVRSKSIEGKTNPDSTVNHMMDARFKFDSLTDNVKELIRLILESAFEYQSNLKK